MKGWMKYVCNEHYRVPTSIMGGWGANEEMLIEYYNAWKSADFKRAFEDSDRGQVKWHYKVKSGPTGYLQLDGIMAQEMMGKETIEALKYRWYYGFDSAGKLILLVDNRYELLNTMPDDGTKPELYFV